MALNTHWKYMYADGVAELAGSQSRSLLKELVRREAKKGEAVAFDAIGPDEEATATALASITDSRADYEAGAKALSDLQAMMTPHMDVTKDRTWVTPVRVDTGHTFRNEDEVCQGASSQSDTLKALMKRIFKREDALILAALSGATSVRGRTTGSTVSFPNAQKITEADGKYDKETIAKIKKLFENNYLNDEPIYCLINPDVKFDLIANDGDKIQSRDFITSVGDFERGTLPDIYGVRHVVVPALASTEFYAFVPSGIVLNQFQALETALNQSIDYRNQWVLYIAEFLGCGRLDDYKVVQGTLTGNS